MATSLDIIARASVSWTYVNTATHGDTTHSHNFLFNDTLANGTGADNADTLYTGTHTIAASGSLDLDLAGGLTNVFGSSLSFAKIKGVFITWQDDNTATEISVGGDVGAPAALWFANVSDEEKVHKSGFLFHYRSDSAGWPVTATTADVLEITNLDATNSAKILIAIIGTSV